METPIQRRSDLAVYSVHMTYFPWKLETNEITHPILAYLYMQVHEAFLNENM